MSFINKVAPTKPLKGGSIVSNFGSFDTLSATTLLIENVDFSSLADGGTFTNSDILDATINRSTIGLNIPSIGYFTELRAFDDVTFISSVIGATASWDVDTGTFTISSAGSFEVVGCSKLGNLEICNNYIKAVNTNGDINLTPNGFGSVFLNGPVYNASTFGSFFIQMTNGGVTFDVDDDINFSSSHGNANITSFGDQRFSTINGDLILNVDQGITETFISSVGTTVGKLFVTTSFPNNLKASDIINITGNSTINGNFTVDTVISDNRFLLTTTSASVITGSGGSYLKYPNNNILLNSGTFVKVPVDTKLSFGGTCNSISGNSSALTITSCGDIFLNAPFDKSVVVPEATKLQFGSSGSNYVSLNSGVLGIVAEDDVRVSSKKTRIDSTNASFYDPVLTIGDYTYSNYEAKDRGIEFRYFDDNQMKLGWFGFKTSSGSFSFLTDVTNTDELMSGSKGNLDVGAISVSSIQSAGDVTLDCANIVGVNILSGCGGTLTIQGTSNVVVQAVNGTINLVAGIDVLVPHNVPVKFGTSGNYVMERAGGDFVVSSHKNVEFYTQSRGAVVIPRETYISFDGSTFGNQRISSDSAGNLKLEGHSDIMLTTTSGNIKVPDSTRVHFGSSDASISGNSSGLIVMSTNAVGILASVGNIELATTQGDINLLTTHGNVRIPQTKALVFSLRDTTNSVSLSTFGNLVVFGNSANNLQVSNFDDIYLSAHSNIYVPTNTKLQFSSSDNQYIARDESEELFVVNSAPGGAVSIISDTLHVSSGTFVLTGTGALLDVTNVTIKDPILTIGETTIDNKDRGIEYYKDAETLGWFGYKSSTGRFTVYDVAVNTDEVITGTLGELHVGSAYIDNELQFLGSGSLDLNCGNIINASSIRGCSGLLDIQGMDTVSIRATSMSVSGATFEFDVDTHVKVPYNVPIFFGEFSNSAVCDTNGNLDITATNELSLYANVEIRGENTNIHSTVVNIQDPIVSIGGITLPTEDDDKDRGIEFKWHDGASSKTGFFGMKDSYNRFVYIPDGTNNDEVFSGIFGDAQFGTGYFDNLKLQNGEISGVRLMSGGEMEIMSTSGNIYITPTQNVVLPFDVDIAFGSTTNSIGADSSGNVIVSAEGEVRIVGAGLIVDVESQVEFPGDVPIKIGDTDLMSSAGNFVITNSTGNIELTPENGIVEVPTNTFLAFGSTSNSIYSDGAELFINGFNSVSISSGSLIIGGNVVIEGSLDTDTYILPLGTFQKLDITSITNHSQDGILVTTLDVHYLTVGDMVDISATNSVPRLEGSFTVAGIISGTQFYIDEPSILFTTDGTVGKVKSNLKTDQGKDVGIQVNYWRDKTSNGVTSGSVNYNTGFFGYKIDTNRWTFYDEATISNFVVSGTLGDIEVNKVFANRMSGFVLEGDITAGSNAIVGSNFNIAGGSINTTPIGQSSAAPGRFTTLTSTVSAVFNNVALNQSLTYSIERYQLNSGGVQFRNPTTTSIVSLFSVVGVNYNGSSGTMPSTAVSDGTLKYLVCGSIGEGCSHTVFFGAGRIIAPTQPSNPSPTKLVFKRAGQSAQLMFSSVDNSWILLNAGAYVA
jgi:hypothetical protein